MDLRLARNQCIIITSITIIILSFPVFQDILTTGRLDQDKVRVDEIYGMTQGRIRSQ